MIRVYHAIDPTFSLHARVPEKVSLDKFTHVANVDTDDLDTAFQLTNHIDCPWQHNQRVLAQGQKHQRSTSVGDVLQEGDTGVLHMVAPFGFVEVNKEAR
jgi:hypothetical protein